MKCIVVSYLNETVLWVEQLVNGGRRTAFRRAGMTMTDWFRVHNSYTSTRHVVLDFGSAAAYKANTIEATQLLGRFA